MDDRFYSLAEIKEEEQRAMSKGITAYYMMDKVGRFVSSYMSDNYKAGKVVFVAGTGNNGGDTLSSAFHAFSAGFTDIQVFIVGEEVRLKDDPKKYFEALKKIGTIPLYFISDIDGLHILMASISIADIVVVGLFGAGFHGEPDRFHYEVISAINNCTKPAKISIDVPSGVNADSGEFKIAVKSDVTVTVGHMKKCFAVKQVRDICGKIVVAEIFP